MTRIKAVLLDADGTLWDTPAAMSAGGVQAAQVIWPQLSPQEAHAVAARFQQDPRGVFRAFVAGTYSFEEMRVLRLKDAASAFDLPWQDGHVTAFEAAYQPVFDQALAAFPDAQPLLAWLAEHEIPVRVLTNSAQAYTEGKIEAVGLRALSGQVCSRDCVGVGKPAPEVFHHACEVLGIAPSDCAYVGDEWTSDVIGSSGAGLYAVWLRRAAGEAAGEEQSLAERLAVARERGIPVVESLSAVPGLLTGE